MAFTPTCLIGLNSDLKMPKMQFVSNAKPSTYGYPAPLEEKKKEVAEKVTAVLSITAKAKKKDDERKKKEQKEEKMEVDDEKKDEKKEKDDKDKEKDKDKEEKKKEEKEKEKDEKKDVSNKKDEEKKKEEPNFDMLNNPARVMKQQLKVIRMPDNGRYTPVKDLSIGGIILMRDNEPGQGQDLVQPVPAHGPKTEEEAEPQPPEPFEFVDDE